MGTNLLIYEFLREERDDVTGLAGPIRNTDIGAILGVSTTTAAFGIAALLEFGLIRRVRRLRSGGSVYEIMDIGAP